MLRLSTKLLNIHLNHDSLILEIQEGFFTRKVLDKRIINLDKAQHSPLPAFKKIEEYVNQYRNSKFDVSIILSNTYIKTLIATWDVRLSDQERIIFLEHSFLQTHAINSSKWKVFLSDSVFGKNQIACAIDLEFLNNLRSIFTHKKHRLISIKPAFVEAINRFRKKIKKNSWFVMVESNHMQLIKFTNGEASIIRSAELDSGWESRLEKLLARESLFIQQNQLPIYFYSKDTPSTFNIQNLNYLKVESTQKRAWNFQLGS